MICEEIDVDQGSNEWLELRKTKITSTDASVIMGVNPWKSMDKLREDKLSNENRTYINAAMQRGIDLEPAALRLYQDLYSVILRPKVFLNGFAMASLDGICDQNHHMIEIKCPGEKTHAQALNGNIPAYYYAQMQHQMFVLGLDHMYYFSFDGFFGHRIEVKRDASYIEEMQKREKEFYDTLFCLDDKSLEA